VATAVTGVSALTNWCRQTSVESPVPERGSRSNLIADTLHNHKVYRTIIKFDQCLKRAIVNLKSVQSQNKENSEGRNGKGERKGKN